MGLKCRLLTVGLAVVMAVGLVVPAASAASIHKSKPLPHCPDFIWYCYIVHHHKLPPLEPWIR